MTLVLAAACDDIVFIVGDTLLTSDLHIKGQEGPVNGASHALKIHVLESGEVAIAFAGDFGIASACIAEVAERMQRSRGEDPCSILVEHLKRDRTPIPLQAPDFFWC